VSGPVEACFLIGRDGAVLWAERSSDPAALPDSRSRWEAIWRHREDLVTVAHSHPHGPAAPSSTDRSTMEGVDAALGRALDYAVVTPGAMILCREGEAWVETDEPWWAWLLRTASGMTDETDRPPGTRSPDDGEEEPRWPS
jgi:hypothetical protein